MSAETLIKLSMIIPLVGAIAIALAGRINDNLRETVTLITAGSMVIDAPRVPTIDSSWAAAFRASAAVAPGTIATRAAS